MSDTAFLILSYCDSYKKEQKLKESFQFLKQFDIPICIYDNYKSYCDLGQDYYIADSTNPICRAKDRTIMWFREFGPYKLFTHKPDYGYAVCHMVKNGTNYLKSLGFKNIIVFNYDVEIPAWCIEDTLILLKTKKSMFYKWDERKSFRFNSCYFSFNIDDNYDQINSISYKDYLDFFHKNGQNGFAEEYLWGKLSKNKNYLLNTNQNVNETISVENDDPFDRYKAKNFQFFIGKEKNAGKELNSSAFVISKNNNFDSITLHINKQEVYNITDNYFKIPQKMSEIKHIFITINKEGRAIAVKSLSLNEFDQKNSINV